ncbi:hypothetical protein HY642_04695 [Candidatus Woesearchaeota archaeon]|nr:hypothetical protein [Candidatus Woesearchaeota archaeon]
MPEVPVKITHEMIDAFRISTRDTNPRHQGPDKVALAFQTLLLCYHAAQPLDTRPVREISCSYRVPLSPCEAKVITACDGDVLTARLLADNSLAVDASFHLAENLPSYPAEKCGLEYGIRAEDIDEFKNGLGCDVQSWEYLISLSSQALISAISAEPLLFLGDNHELIRKTTEPAYITHTLSLFRGCTAPADTVSFKCSREGKPKDIKGKTFYTFRVEAATKGDAWQKAYDFQARIMFAP